MPKKDRRVRPVTKPREVRAQVEERPLPDFKQALFRNPDVTIQFSSPADHPLAAEFEDQTPRLNRDYTGDGEYLPVHHPDGRDDSPDYTDLALSAVP